MSLQKLPTEIFCMIFEELPPGDVWKCGVAVKESMHAVKFFCEGKYKIDANDILDTDVVEFSKYLQFCTKLEEFTLTNERRKQQIEWLKIPKLLAEHCPVISSITFYGIILEENEMQALSLFTTLKIMRVCFSAWNETFRSIFSNNPKLQEITLKYQETGRYFKFTNEDVFHIVRVCRSLQDLDITASDVTTEVAQKTVDILNEQGDRTENLRMRIIRTTFSSAPIVHITGNHMHPLLHLNIHVPNV